MSEEVTFPKGQRLDPEHQEAKELVQLALTDGEDCLTEFEEKFLQSAHAGIKKFGNEWELSSARKDVLKAIHRKLKKEGLVD